MLPPKFLPKKKPPPRGLHAQVLAEWRGIDLETVEAVRSKPAKPAGGVIQNVLHSIRFDQRRSETEIVKVWNHLIDPNIIAHAQPVGIRQGTLFVNVDSHAWLSDIVRYHRYEILERLQHSFGKDLIAKISFRVV